MLKLLNQLSVTNIKKSHSVNALSIDGHDPTDVDFTLNNEASQTRGILTESFRNIGFRPLKTNALGTPDKLLSAIIDGEIEFLVMEADKNSEHMYEFIRDIRHGRIGANPYLVVTIVTWRPDGQMIKDFIDAGTDDVLVMPASTCFASGRVDQLIDHRREFVVTTRYIGPDRRTGGRGPNDELGTFKVPNCLRYKATGDETAKPNSAHLEHANDLVKAHRLRRAALRLERLAAQAERFRAAHPGTPLPDTPLEELLTLVDEIPNRTSGEGRVDVSELIASMGDIRQAILTGASANPDIYVLLKVYAKALLALQRGDKKASDLVLRAVRKAKQVVEERGQGLS